MNWVRLGATLIIALSSGTSAIAQEVPGTPAPAQDLVSRQVELYRASPEAGQPMSRDFLHPVTRTLPVPIAQAYRAYSPRPVPSHHPLLSPALHSEWDRKFGLPLTLGNRIEILRNRETFEEKFRLLNSARESIIAATMLLSCDASVEPLVDRMIERSREGVRITLILDRFFSIGHDDCISRLKQAGVQVAWSTRSLSPIDRLFFHQKFWIRDGEEALIEGANLIDIQTDADGFNGLYRDTGARVRGPVVTDLLEEAQNLLGWLKVPRPPGVQASIEQKRASERSQGLRDASADRIKTALRERDGACRLVSQGGPRPRSLVSQAYLDLIDSAREHITISSQRRDLSRFRNNSRRWDNQLLQRIFEKSHEPGLHVDLQMNFHNTPFSVTPPNARSTPPVTRLMLFYEKITLDRQLDHALRVLTRQGGTGLQVWSYFQYFHSKHLLIDQMAGVVGSFNLDRVSTQHSLEIALICHDARMIEQLQEMTALDLINSVPMLRR